MRESLAGAPGASPSADHSATACRGGIARRLAGLLNGRRRTREGSVGDGDPLREQPVLGVETVGSAIVVRLGGELDLYNADQVRAALADAVAGSSRVVADLAEVLFV